MFQRSKRLKSLLGQLNNDIEKEDNSTDTQKQQPPLGICIVGDNNTFAIGNQCVISPKITDSSYTNNCKACGHIVAKAAKSCPGCGQPLKVSRFKRHILLGAILLAPLVTSPPPLFGFIH
jgi:rubrerythrin